MSEEKLTQINYHGSFEFASHNENSRKNGAFLLLFYCRPHRYSQLNGRILFYLALPRLNDHPLLALFAKIFR